MMGALPLPSGSQEDLHVLAAPPGAAEDLAPADEDYVLALQQKVQCLVDLDVRFGGDHTSALALRALAAVRHDLDRRGIRRRAERDVRAAVAEFAELTGWLLCDANRHAQSYRVNRHALALARTAGDRSMELFVLHNLSLQALYLRRPISSLLWVEPILDHGGLTPRLTAMFKLRVARAYAQMGLRTEATKTLDSATGLLSEGVSDRDPGWAWWVSERGFNHATGAMLGSLGDWKAAIDPISHALMVAPHKARRDRFLYLCVLMHAQLEAGAWHDAESTVDQLLPLLGTVRSTRPLTRLSATLDQFRRNERPPRSARRIIDDIWHTMNLSGRPQNSGEICTVSVE
ncbi:MULTISPECIES: hypothetical protein [Actinomadura]|uniref:DNA-binding protein n=1 Tax=Actinomadura yumaensis TaxID=111807 RepID=A0ABW2CI78_9ACTN|nr:hypothetical protein [Actinomadura sp. J1-007]MWK37129.1 hypothetical protein [Actinomadura sp. J1-007]